MYVYVVKYEICVCVCSEKKRCSDPFPEKLPVGTWRSWQGGQLRRSSWKTGRVECCGSQDKFTFQVGDVVSWQTPRWGLQPSPFYCISLFDLPKSSDQYLQWSCLYLSVLVSTFMHVDFLKAGLLFSEPGEYLAHSRHSNNLLTDWFIRYRES